MLAMRYDCPIINGTPVLNDKELMETAKKN